MTTPGEWQDLRLSDREVAALRRQGFVATDRLPSGRPCYKLRFRCDGRQCVRYLGDDPAVADSVRERLQRHQQAADFARQVKRLPRETGRAMRELKQALSERLAAAGLHFHGFEVRQKRGRKDEG